MGEYVVFEAIRGPEGTCLAVGAGDDISTRLAGPKPWGGGTVIHRWEVSVGNVLEEVSRAAGLLAENGDENDDS